MLAVGSGNIRLNDMDLAVFFIHEYVIIILLLECVYKLLSKIIFPGSSLPLLPNHSHWPTALSP